MLAQSVVLLLAIIGPITEAKTPWFQIGFAGGGLGVTGKSHISFQRVTTIKNYKIDKSVSPRWEADLFTENGSVDGKVTRTHQRADGRVCPGVAASLQLLATIPPLKPQAPDAMRDQWLPLPPADGVAYFYNRYGRIEGSDTLYSEEVGDAAGLLLQPIWNRISNVLQPCWAAVPEGSL